jgi:hypothetical protein
MEANGVGVASPALLHEKEVCRGSGVRPCVGVHDGTRRMVLDLVRGPAALSHLFDSEWIASFVIYDCQKPRGAMSESRSGSSFERALSIVHEGLREARENADDVRKVAAELEIGFMDVVAAAIASEFVKEFQLEELPIVA